MNVHLLFVTKYRRGVFTAQMLHDLRTTPTAVCSDLESQLVDSTARITMYICP